MGEEGRRYSWYRATFRRLIFSMNTIFPIRDEWFSPDGTVRLMERFPLFAEEKAGAKQGSLLEGTESA